MAAPARPDTVTAASILWIIVGAMLIPCGLWVVLRALEYGYLPTTVGSLIFMVIVTGIGVAFWNLSMSLRRGRDSRAILTALGLICCLCLCPAVLAVPAIVLQYSASSKQWFNLRRGIPGDQFEGVTE
jgi:ABC-type amino acid transport system permease subunit